jgi:hypothetical protein
MNCEVNIEDGNRIIGEYVPSASYGLLPSNVYKMWKKAMSGNAMNNHKIKPGDVFRGARHDTYIYLGKVKKLRKISDGEWKTTIEPCWLETWSWERINNPNAYLHFYASKTKSKNLLYKHIANMSVDELIKLHNKYTRLSSFASTLKLADVEEDIILSKSEVDADYFVNHYKEFDSNLVYIDGKYYCIEPYILKNGHSEILEFRCTIVASLIVTDSGGAVEYVKAHSFYRDSMDNQLLSIRIYDMLTSGMITVYDFKRRKNEDI